MSRETEVSKKDLFLEKISNFLYNNRTVLLVLLAIIILGVIGFSIYSEFSNSINEQASQGVEKAQELYGEWTEAEVGEKEEIENEFFDVCEKVLTEYADSAAAQKVLFIRGQVFAEKEDWQNAVNDYMNLVDNYANSHLTPIALTNAAAAYEAIDDVDKAIEILEKITKDYKGKSIEYAHAVFSLGRLNEEKGNFDEALTFYNELIEEFSSSGWTKIAKNRKIYINTQK